MCSSVVVNMLYCAVFSPGHFGVAARYAFILEGLMAATL